MNTALAERIDCLFRTHRSPRGCEYTHREGGIGDVRLRRLSFSSAYLWQLRTGAKDNPTIRHVEALARFFDISPAHFFDDEPTDPRSRNSAFSPRPRHRLPRASATSLVGLSDDSLDAVLQLTGRPFALEELPYASGVTGNDARNGRRHRKLRRKGNAASPSLP